MADQIIGQNGTSFMRVKTNTTHQYFLLIFWITKNVIIFNKKLYFSKTNIFWGKWFKTKHVDTHYTNFDPFNQPTHLTCFVVATFLCLTIIKQGLLKGGSKKRGTSLDDISHPLPSNAVWKNVSLFHGKKERQYLQGWTHINEPLCKLCQKVCM